MSRCLVLEDDYIFFLEVKLELEKFNVSSIIHCKDIKEFKEYLALGEKLDLIIADLVLADGDISWNYLKEVNVGCPIIITSALRNQELYDEIQGHSSILYLVKPISLLTLGSAIRVYLKESEDRSSIKNDKFLLKGGGKQVPLFYDDIYIVKSEGNYCIFYLKNSQKTARVALFKLKHLYDHSDFIQVHRSFLVNISKIDKLELGKNQLTINNVTIKIGRKYKNTLSEKIKNRFGNTQE